MSVADELIGLFEQFKAAHEGRYDKLVSDIANLEQAVGKGQTAGLMGNSATTAGRKFVNVAGRMVPILACDEKLQAFTPAVEGEDRFTLSDFVKANLGLPYQGAVTSGPATVPTYVGSEIIDLVRAQATVVRAGSGTINLDGPTNLARVTADPTVHQHTEGAADVSESDVTVEAVACNPKALVALVPLSAEIVADSANLDAVLNTSLAAAFAQKLDALCLATLLADANIPASSVAHATATWAGTLLAIAAAMNADQGIPASYIMNAGDFVTRSGLLASTAGSWLGKPPFLAGMQELPTTKLTAGLAIFGNFADAFAITVRQDVKLEVVRYAKPGSYSHLLVAHARMDGVVLQPDLLFNQKLVP